MLKDATGKHPMFYNRYNRDLFQMKLGACIAEGLISEKTAMRLDSVHQTMCDQHAAKK